jgi:hypothetical protein
MAVPREVDLKIVDCCFDTPILLLGKVGENLATKVTIDASEWQDGSGTFQLLVKRADEEMFTATISQDNGVVTWLVPGAEIGAAGYGEIELNYIVDDTKIKSARVDTRVFSSIEIDSLPPNGLTWSQMVLAAIQDARDAAEDAQDAEGEIEDMLADAVAEATDRAEAAAGSAEDAAQSASDDADDAADSAKLAESFAKGGTSTRQGEDTDNAKYYKEQAGVSEARSLLYKNACEAAHDEIFDILNNATILDTTETVTLNADNLVQQIVHTSNDTGSVVRTDVFTYNGAVVTEVRTAADGRTQTNIYNLDTLEQQFNV